MKMFWRDSEEISVLLSSSTAHTSSILGDVWLGGRPAFIRSLGVGLLCSMRHAEVRRRAPPGDVRAPSIQMKSRWCDKTAQQWQVTACWLPRTGVGCSRAASGGPPARFPLRLGATVPSMSHTRYPKITPTWRVLGPRCDLKIPEWTSSSFTYFARSSFQ